MDNTLYRHYYKIPTAEGYFYFYREYLNRGWDNTTGGTNYEYNDFIEFFTGLVATQHNNLLDLYNKKDLIIFKTITEELIKLDYEAFDEKLKYTDILSYHYMNFHASYKSNNYSFSNKANYKNKLPYRDSRFITSLDTYPSIITNKFIYPDYDYYKLSSLEFANEIKKLIERFGSKEEVANIMLKKIEKQSLICKERDEYINNQLSNNKEENSKAEEYIKKLIY